MGILTWYRSLASSRRRRLEPSPGTDDADALEPGPRFECEREEERWRDEERVPLARFACWELSTSMSNRWLVNALRSELRFGRNGDDRWGDDIRIFREEFFFR